MTRKVYKNFLWHLLERIERFLEKPKPDQTSSRLASVVSILCMCNAFKLCVQDCTICYHKDRPRGKVGWLRTLLLSYPRSTMGPETKYFNRLHICPSNFPLGPPTSKKILDLPLCHDNVGFGVCQSRHLIRTCAFEMILIDATLNLTRAQCVQVRVIALKYEINAI